MDAGWRRIKQTFQRALEFDGSERRRFLDGACRADAVLRREVESLLAAHDGNSGFLEAPISWGRTASALGDAFELKSGSSLGCYRIERAIGRGGQAQVYLAEDTRLGRKVALKVLAPSFGTSRSPLLRFEREAKAAARVDHEGICPVYDAGCEGIVSYIAMRYIDGATLEELIAREKARRGLGRDGHERQAPGPAGAAEGAGGRSESLWTMVALTERAARILHAAHQSGLIHRDVKPSNIMVTPEGNPVILDFGLARDEEGVLPAITDSHVEAGTSHYMAPERLSPAASAQERRIDRRVDVFALGVTLYECVTLRRPFEGSTPEEVRWKILTASPPDPRRYERAVPRDLQTIIETALEKAPERRYSSALALAEDLRRARRREPISARPVGPVLRLWRWTQRNPKLAAASAVALLALAGALVLSIVYGLSQRRMNEALEEQLSRSLFARRRELCENGQIEKGLHLLARALHEAPRGSGPLQETLRLNLAAWRQALWPLRGLLEHEGGIRSLAFSSDGQRLLTAGGRTARLWSAAGSPIGEPMVHGGPVRAQFSGDGQRVVTASEDATARVWSAIGGEPLSPPLPHSSPVLAAALDTGGTLAVTGCLDGTATVWTVATGTPAGPRLAHQHSVFSVAFHPRGDLVATGSKDETARIWDWRAGTEIVPPLEHGFDGFVVSLVFSDDGRRLLTASWDRTARLWSVETGALVGQPMRHDWYVYTARFSPDGTRIVTASGDRTARVWSAEDGAPLGPPLRHPLGVMEAVFSPDGERLLTGGIEGSTGTAKLWSAATGALLAPPLRHGDLVLVVVFRSDGRVVVTGSADGTARLWSAADGAPLGPVLEHRGSVYAVAFRPGAESIATGAVDGTVRLWSSDGSPLGAPLVHPTGVTGIAFSPDGMLLLTATIGGAARVWSPETFDPIGPALQHPDAVMSCAFSPDGSRLLTSCLDGAARVWEVPRPIAGDPALVTAWVEAATGSAAAAGEPIERLSRAAWLERLALAPTTGER